MPTKVKTDPITKLMLIKGPLPYLVARLPGYYASGNLLPVFVFRKFWDCRKGNIMNSIDRIYSEKSCL